MRHPMFWGFLFGAGAFYLYSHVGHMPALGGGQVAKTGG